MKTAAILAFVLSLLFSCVDVVWTNYTVRYYDGAWETFNSWGIWEGMAAQAVGERRYSGHPEGLHLGVHWPQAKAIAYAGGWMGIGGRGISVWLLFPILAALWLMFRCLSRKMRALRKAA